MSVPSSPIWLWPISAAAASLRMRLPSTRAAGYPESPFLVRQLAKRRAGTAMHVSEPCGLRGTIAGIAHAERREDSCREKGIERLSGQRLEEEPNRVGARAVSETLAGILDQERRMDQIWLRTRSQPQRFVQPPVAIPSRVAQELPERRRSRGRPRRVPTRLLVKLEQHLGRLEARNVIAERRIEIHETFVDENHDADRRHELGHRCDAEDRVGPHGHARFGRRNAERLDKETTRRRIDRRDDAGNQTFADGAGQNAIDRRQPLGFGT
jgi:hypothetical protein